MHNKAWETPKCSGTWLWWPHERWWPTFDWFLCECDIQGGKKKTPYEGVSFSNWTNVPSSVTTWKPSWRIPQNTTQLSLIFAYVTGSDILQQAELEEMERQYWNQIKIFFKLSSIRELETRKWQHYCWHSMRKHLLPSGSDSDALDPMCGPPGQLRKSAR